MWHPLQQFMADEAKRNAGRAVDIVTFERELGYLKQRVDVQLKELIATRKRLRRAERDLDVLKGKQDAD
jgi:hypothetical protein